MRKMGVAPWGVGARRAGRVGTEEGRHLQRVPSLFCRERSGPLSKGVFERAQPKAEWKEGHPGDNTLNWYERGRVPQPL